MTRLRAVIATALAAGRRRRRRSRWRRRRASSAVAASCRPSATSRRRCRRCRDPSAIPTSTIVVDRDGKLLRPFTIADGRWRLPVTTAEVDPRFLDMLIGYEDRRFAEHRRRRRRWRSLRAAGQFVLAGGHIVSGGSTLTMQVARLIDGEGTRSIAGKLRQIAIARALETPLQQGRDPRPLPDARALWRQHRGHPRREPRLFRQGADAADDGRGGAARRAAAVAGGAPARPRPGGRAGRARPRARPAGAGRRHRRRRGRGGQDRARADGAAAVPDAGAAPRRAGGRRRTRSAPVHRLTIDRDLQASLEALAADRVAALGPKLSVAIVVADHMSGAILASVGSAGLFEEGARRLRRHDARRALAGLDAEAADLRPRLRGRARPSGKPDRGPADRLRRLRAAELRRLPPRHGDGARGADPVAQRPGDRRARRGRPGAAGGAAEARGGRPR